MTSASISPRCLPICRRAIGLANAGFWLAFDIHSSITILPSLIQPRVLSLFPSALPIVVVASTVAVPSSTKCLPETKIRRFEGIGGQQNQSKSDLPESTSLRKASLPMPMDTFAAAVVSVRPLPVSLDFGSADGIRRKTAAMAKKQPLTRASRRRPATAQGSQRQRPQVHGDHQPSPPLSVAHHGTLPLSPLAFATGVVQQQQQINLAADPDPMLSSTRLHSPPAPPMPGTEADYHPKLLHHPHLARSVSSLPLSEEDHLLLELDENKEEEEEEDPFLLLDNTRHRLSPSFSPPSSSNANSSPLDEMFQPNPAAGNNSNYFSSAQRRPHSGAAAAECSLLLAADKMNSPISSTLAPLQSLVAQRQQHSHFGGGNWPMIGATGSPTTSPCSLPSPNEFLHQSANTANFPLMSGGCHDGSHDFFPVGCGCGGLSSSSQNSSSTSSLHLLSYQQQQQQHQPHSHLNSDAEPKFTVSAAPPLAFLASSNGNDPVGSFADIPQRRVIVLDTSSANLYASGHHQSLGSPTASFLSQNVNGNFHHPSYSNQEHQSNCHNNGNLFATEDGHGNITSFSSAAGGGLVSIKYEYDSGAVPPPTSNSSIGINHFSSHQGHHNFVYQHQSQQQNLAQHLSMQSAPFPNPISCSRSGPAFLIGTDQQQQLKAEVGEVKYSTQLQAAEARKAGAEFDLHIGANGQQLIINNGKSSDGEKTAAEELTQQQYNIYIDYGNHNSTLMPTAANFLDATEEATGARCQQKSPAAYGKHSNGQSKANNRKLEKSRQTPMAQQQQPTIAVTSQLLDGAGIEPMFGDDQLIFPGSPCSFGEVGGFLDCDGNSRGEAEEIDTLRLAQHISQELKRYSIPQAIFAQRVLCRSQGTLSDLLRNPKPWAKLKSGRETFRRMAKWLQEPELHRMSALRLAACKRKEELVIRESAAAVVAASAAAAEANNQQQQQSSPQSPPPSQLSANGDANGESSSGRSPATEDDTKSPNNNGGGGNGNNRNASGGAAAQQKKPRLVFTDIQRRTLQAIFNETKRPSRELQVQIAQQLQLDPTTVANFFMNARRRGHGLQLTNGSNGTSEMAAAVLPVDGTGSCCTPQRLIGSSSSCNSNSLCSSSVSTQCSAASTPSGHEAIGSGGNRIMLKPLDASNSPPVTTAMQPNWGIVEAANEEMTEQERSQFGKADVKEEEQEVEHQAGGEN